MTDPIQEIFPDLSNAFLSRPKPSPIFSAATDAVGPDAFRIGLRALSHKQETCGDRTVIDTKWMAMVSELEADVRYTAFRDTSVLELEGRMTNRGKKTIKGFRGPFPLFLTCDLRGMGLPRVTTVHGGASTDGCYPPPSYRVSETDLTPHGGLTLIGGRESGRSTEGPMPYLILTDPQTGSGMWVVLEWPCRWIMNVSVGEDTRGHRELSLYAHPGWICTDLKPGESVVIPKVDIGFFQVSARAGDSVAGSNALRRHIVNHVMRPVEGASSLPPVFYNHWYGLNNADFNETILRREADAYAELGAEYFIVDAGWYEGYFRNGIGNWELDDRRRFPNGMAEFSRYVEAKGMKFGSWLEIEFAMKNSDWGRRHRDWFRDAGERQNQFYGITRNEELLLRLEDASVRSQVADFLESWVQKYRIQWVRWDFNDGPAAFWEAHETEDRVGWLHLGYGAGLLALLDDFRDRCPQVHVEACAGGGHRMDLGTLRRANSAWMNDNSHSYDAIRCFQKGLNRVLPGNYGNSCFLWATHESRRTQSLASLRRDGYPPCILRSRMAGTLGFAEQSRLWTRAIRATLRDEVAKYKSIRHLIQKDFHPLFNPTSLCEYDGVQFHDPDTGEGYFMVFRCESDDDAAEVVLPGLETDVTYRLVDMDSGTKRKLKGGKSLRVEVPARNGTRWCRYEVE